MQSPPKQPEFTASTTATTTEPEWDDTIAKPIEGLPRLQRDDAVTQVENSVASTIKSDEADEPLLRENPNRFVLFPIKYHEVRFSAQRVDIFISTSHDDLTDLY